MSAHWNPDFFRRSPLFEPLRAAAHELSMPCWPRREDLNRVFASRGATNASGRPLCFVEPPRRKVAFEDQYEPSIFLRGEIQLRPCNWHDLLNALVWMTFPMAKAALNRRHCEEIERTRSRGERNRGPVRDALTLFDEGGLLVAVSEPILAALLTEFKWKSLFWERRCQVIRSMRYFIFGHALYEKALEPYPGVTGRGIVFSVDNAFFQLPLDQQLTQLDQRLACCLGDRGKFAGTAELSPIPILGVPGWCEYNTREQYYDDTTYFRPGKSGKSLTDCC